LIYFPARLLLRNWGVKVPIILQDEGINGTVTIRRFKPRNTREVTIAGDRSAYSFNLGEESVEILALGAVLFSESRLHQTPEAKSVVNSYHAATVRALVVIVRRC
jgi:hypothetical protein